MRVIEVQRHGGPEVLALAERPAPAPGPGQRLNSGGSVFVTRPTLAHHAADAAELHWQAGEVLDRVARGELSVRIGGRYPLADAARAQQDLASRGTTGKLLLIP
jgi:NADPH2:quinone reductase